jgi:4-amino-4-deoxy-L-arabinose transferase-like glycosyltransferase
LDQTLFKILKDRSLLRILALGLALKLIYLFGIGPAVFGDRLLVTDDSKSYTNAFLNLVHSGEFSHDLSNPEASYGRMPFMAFAWGLFYLMLGKAKDYWGLAIFQIFLDGITGLMIFRIITKFFERKTALMVCLIYVLFPLNWFFIVRTDYNFFALFFTIAVFYKLIFFSKTLGDQLVLGLLLVLGFYVRETLLLLLPITFLYFLRNGIPFKQYGFVFLTVFLLYLPWPVRTFIKTGHVVAIKPLSAGYAEYNIDMLSYMYWLYSWHNDHIDEYLSYSYRLEKDIIFPDEVFASVTEKQLAINTVKLAQTCGTSFVTWQRLSPEEHLKRTCNRNILISQSFGLLKESYRKRHSFQYYVSVPLQNLRKALFKFSLLNPNRVSPWIFKTMMLCRSFLLGLGLLACFIYRKNNFFLMCLTYFLVIYLFMCFILRQIEMRYLYEADVLMLICASVLVAVKFFENKRSIA